jgi:small-conductance mechanosensitive channel
MAGDLARHLLQLRVGQDEVKHLSTHLTSTKSYFRLEQKSMGSSMLEERILITLAVVAVAVIFRVAIGGVFKRKLHELVGHQLLANVLTGVLGIGLIIYLLYVWGVVMALIEIVATFGIITTILLFTIKDIWLSNLFAGLSLIGDKLINIGSEVEIGGRRGKIVEMTLTVTKVKTADGDLMIVPNKKFKEDVVVVVKKRG